MRLSSTRSTLAPLLPVWRLCRPHRSLWFFLSFLLSWVLPLWCFRKVAQTRWLCPFDCRRTTMEKDADASLPRFSGVFHHGFQFVPDCGIEFDFFRHGQRSLEQRGPVHCFGDYIARGIRPHSIGLTNWAFPRAETSHALWPIDRPWSWPPIADSRSRLFSCAFSGACLCSGAGDIWLRIRWRKPCLASGRLSLLVVRLVRGNRWLGPCFR